MTARVIIDHTHCGRHVTGLERITLELFSAEALAPLDVMIVRAGDRRGMMVRQNLQLPIMTMANRRALVLCPGFPPSFPLALAGGNRVVPYIHDLFLLTRPQDLNRRAKLYMVAPFRHFVRTGQLFLVNSQTTADELRRFCRRDAEIVLYRPGVRNVFGLAEGDRFRRAAPAGALRLVAVGTVEPRKNLFAAAAILTALRQGFHAEATLDIVGRPGWGVSIEDLSAVPGVTVHGYQPAERVRHIIEDADALISTSHDEGLGLPLLEAQYAGLPVITPDRPVFREVLGQSGILLDSLEPKAAAAQIGTALSQPDWRGSALERAMANLTKWNDTAAKDREAVVSLLQRRAEEL